MNWLWVYKIIPQGSCCIGIPCAVASNATLQNETLQCCFWSGLPEYHKHRAFIFSLPLFLYLVRVSANINYRVVPMNFPKFWGTKTTRNICVYTYIHIYPEKMLQKWHVLQQSFTGNTANNVVFALFSLFLLQATKLECVVIAGVLGCSLLHNAVNSFLLCKGATQCCKYAENIWKCKHVWLHGGEDLANNNVNNVRFDTICCM